MVLYDYLAPAYDPAFKSIYRPFRERALELLPATAGASVLDLACGTGQNFPLIAERIGSQGKIIGVDISSSMLRRAGCVASSNVSLLRTDAALLTCSLLKAQTGLASVNCVVCSYGFTAMREWKTAFWSSWELLRPGGGYLIHDIDGQKRNFHTRAVEWTTRCDFSQKVWQPLQGACPDFRMDYIEPSAHLFGGRLFAAYGTKPLTPS
jgi:ubiquinone/menaquinone biosynthesis C-methylase UbiE